MEELSIHISANVVLSFSVTPPRALRAPWRYIFFAFSGPPPHLSGLTTELVHAALAGGRRYFSCLIDAV